MADITKSRKCLKKKFPVRDLCHPETGLALQPREIRENEKLIFVYFGFLEKVLAPAFFPVLKELIHKFSQNNKSIKVLFTGKYTLEEKWVIHGGWIKTEKEFNTHLASADLIIQHHGLGTLPKAIRNQVPVICLVPEIKKDIP